LKLIIKELSQRHTERVFLLDC